MWVRGRKGGTIALRKARRKVVGQAKATVYVHVRICSVFLAQATLIYIANFGKYCATACDLHKGTQNMLL